ncbi:MAG TPA: SAM-dependent methyltransferase [Candidatus Onthovicinus excrementipullorum]|nr:SAM-dependent methyltransferase [Candidatus Onthovicinus excrementipullorum]
MGEYRGIRLNPRLSAAAALVRLGRVAADVGTDHAYLPAYLVGSGICPRCIAGDIGEGPLNNARETVCACGLEDRVELVLSDGLEDAAFRAADDIIIAGMGGEMIAAILTRAPYLRDSRYRLILQPMTRAEEVHLFLAENGFSIVEERAVTDAGKVYLILAAEYDGTVRHLSGAQPYIGLLRGVQNPDAIRFIEKQRRRFRKELKGIADLPEKADRADEVRAVLADLERALKGA